MTRRKTGAAVALGLCCAVAGVGLVGCGDSKADAKVTTSVSGPTSHSDKDRLTGIKKITADGHLVNVSCSGSPVENRPVVVLLHGGGDDLTKMSDLQRRIAEKGRVCAYDRLGAGDSAVSVFSGVRSTAFTLGLREKHWREHVRNTCGVRREPASRLTFSRASNFISLVRNQSRGSSDAEPLSSATADMMNMWRRSDWQ